MNMNIEDTHRKAWVGGSLGLHDSREGAAAQRGSHLRLGHPTDKASRNFSRKVNPI